MSDNLTPTPYDAGWRHAWHDQGYNPPAAFHTEYTQGWHDGLDAWDIDQGAETIPEDEMTDAQRAGMARKRAKLGADWPRKAS